MEQSISIVIPVHNDSATIGRTIDELENFLSSIGGNNEIIAVNDGGSDDSRAIIHAKHRIYPRLRFIDRRENRGKGYTVREGLRAANGNELFYTDADLPYRTGPMKHMLEILRSGQADVVLANRDSLTHNHDETVPLPRRITHSIYSRFIRLLLPIPFTDTLAGLKGMTRAAARVVVPQLTIDRFSFDVELLLVAHAAGFRLMDIPVSLQGVGKSNLSIPSDAPQMAKDVIKIWWRYRTGGYSLNDTDRT